MQSDCRYFFLLQFYIINNSPIGVTVGVVDIARLLKGNECDVRCIVDVVGCLISLVINISVMTIAGVVSTMSSASTSVAERQQFWLEFRLSMFMHPLVPSINVFCICSVSGHISFRKAYGLL